MYLILITVFCLRLEPSFANGIGFAAPLKNITVTKGQDITLRCDISSNGVYVRRSWTHQSSIIFADDHKWGTHPRMKLLSDDENEYIMQVRDVSSVDEGFYTCTIYPNETLRSTMYLTVNTPPTFTDVTKDLEVIEGKNVILQCLAEGKPQPRITWRHLVPSADGVRATSEFLPLGRVTRGSGGRYECTADNGVLFPVKSVIRLVVDYPPEIDEYLTEIRVNIPVGKSTSIECVASAVPEPEFMWIYSDGKITRTVSGGRFNIVNVPQGNSVQSTLYLEKLENADFGKYICIASNTLGHANSTIALSEKILAPTRLPPSVLFGIMGEMVDYDDGKGGSSSLKSNQILPMLFHTFILVLFSTFY